MSIKKEFEKITLFTVFFVFDKPRIPQNLRECAIGMLNKIPGLKTKS